MFMSHAVDIQEIQLIYVDIMVIFCTILNNTITVIANSTSQLHNAHNTLSQCGVPILLCSSRLEEVTKHIHTSKMHSWLFPSRSYI